MQVGVPLVELWRGPFAESVHTGHVVICDENGDIVESWGDPEQVVLPRSSAKIIQALPLIESGAADVFSLTTEQLALSCASHQGARIHVDRVESWLKDLGLGESDMRCGPQETADIPYRNEMICASEAPCQLHNNCSGKHAGFLTLSKHLGAGPEYIDLDHPVQLAGKDAWERMTDETVRGFGIDGCSAPNFATSLHGVGRAMAGFATAKDGSAQQRLVEAMALHPELVAGETRACTNLMRAMEGRVVVKTGAEGFFIAIIPELKLGVALKIADGTTRASECAITAILVRLGVLDPNHPEALKYMNTPIRNWRGVQTGWQRPAESLAYIS